MTQVSNLVNNQPFTAPLLIMLYKSGRNQMYSTTVDTNGPRKKWLSTVTKKKYIIGLTKHNTNTKWNFQQAASCGWDRVDYHIISYVNKLYLNLIHI